MSGPRLLGSRAPRLDAPAKATGRAVYTDDLRRPGMLHGAILHSPVAHARIVRVDAGRAAALPGVRAVLTGADVPDTLYGVSPARYDERVLARDKVLYVGDEIAAVAADDPLTARRALELIDVELEELPPVLEAEAALAEGAPQIHPLYPGNLSAEVHQEFGDLAAARTTASLVRRGRLESEMQDGAFLEPQSAIAELDGQGNLTLTSSTQSVHYVQRTVAMVLGWPIERVRVVKPYVGGGFGPKAAASTMELICCLLAVRTGRPVKITFDREQVFLHSRARHKFVHQMELGVDADGKLQYLVHEALLDGGAYASFGIATVYYAGSLLGGPYRLPAMKYDGRRATTNKPACGAQRGHGGVIARALFERLVDEAAEALGLDSIELRLRNMMQAGDVTCNQLNMSSLGMRECIEAVRDGSGWAARRGRLPKGEGLGMACGFFVSGAGYPIYRSDTYHCTVQVKLQEDGGGVLLETASAEIGQGSDTALAMICAETLGVGLDKVRVVSGDTDLGVDLGAYSSRQTLMTGHATREAAADARRQVLEVLAVLLRADPGDLEFVDGLLHSRSGQSYDFAALRTRYHKEHRGFCDNPTGAQLTFAEASRMAYLERGTIVGLGKYRPPPLGGSYKGAAVGTSPAYGCSAQVVQLKVDLETGQIDVRAVTDAHDCGRAINRTSVEGQMQGSISMGLGEALFEAVQFDRQGRILNPNFSDYKIPTALDMPEVRCIVVESNEPNGPYGAKEVGEGAIMPTIPAVLNALYEATGVRFEKLPVTPEQVILAMRAKAEKQPR